MKWYTVFKQSDASMLTPGEYCSKADYDALAAALKVVQDTSIAHAGKQNDRIRSLEADKADLVRVLGVADERIKALEAALRKIVRDGDYTAPEGMKRIAQEALGSELETGVAK